LRVNYSDLDPVVVFDDDDNDDDDDVNIGVGSCISCFQYLKLSSATTRSKYDVFDDERRVMIICTPRGYDRDVINVSSPSSLTSPSIWSKIVVRSRPSRMLPTGLLCNEYLNPTFVLQTTTIVDHVLLPSLRP
jgi:hypothetical protein